MSNRTIDKPATDPKLSARQAKRFERAIRWALGELGDFPGRDRTERDGAWWWRHELQRRAGLRWDHHKQKFVPKEQFRG